ncbi:Peptide deformylase [hydrothermal vent metagenome]|uniref:Peptide deformylase n=1 Tax=hydrothermal vent metagenome TaxID=652676 RepID=A0A3B0ZBG4_9ZZZZ
MTVKQILRIGDPRLLEVAEPIKQFDTPALRALVTDLIETMHAEAGAGLAAPQIGTNLRVIVFGFDSNPRYPDADAVPLTVLINPTIIPLSERQKGDWEGCLSVPGLRGSVPRYTRIRYSGFDLCGNAIEREAGDFHARVVQHECDHLDGILYPQRMRDMRQFGFIDTLEASGQLIRMPCDTSPANPDHAA